MVYSMVDTIRNYIYIYILYTFYFYFHDYYYYCLLIMVKYSYLMAYPPINMANLSKEIINHPYFGLSTH